MNMIQDIYISNFKPFLDKTVSLSPLTLLAGLNNSGKSSLIQAIRMLWKWNESGDPTSPNHGSLNDMKNKSAARSASISMKLTFQNDDRLKFEADFNDPDNPKVSKPINAKLPYLSYVSADRLGPRISLFLHTGIDELSHVGERGEFVIDFLSRHERDILPPLLRHPKAEGQTLEYNVRAWLEEISPSIDVKHSIDRNTDMSSFTIDSFRPTNSGFGLSYTMPVIVSLLGMSSMWEDDNNEKLKSERGSIVLLENPEAHLHPKGQTSIGKLIAYVAASGVQVIVETHSEHVMDGIRIAVKDQKLKARDTKFHYFKREKSYECSIETPMISSEGKLQYWPEGFFDQTLKNRAILARKD